MKIHTMGRVIITDDKDQPIKIEGWNIELDETDPKNAKPEELIVSFTTRWAMDKLIQAVDVATRDVLKKWAATESMKQVKQQRPN